MPKACPYVLMEIWVVLLFVGAFIWKVEVCGGLGEMKQRQEAVASGAVLV